MDKRIDNGPMKESRNRPTNGWAIDFDMDVKAIQWRKESFQ